jgi:single-stranded-DNA-specific exonuclease
MANHIKKKWTLQPRIPAEVSEELDSYPYIFRQILYNRGIDNRVEAQEFLNAQGPCHDPADMKGMPEAVALIHQVIADRQRVVVFGDYDVDGVTATVLLVQLLQKYDADVRMYIPNRFKEGYGFSFDALKEVLALEPALIITVDCGVRSVKEVSLAAVQGVQTIITDHHQPAEELPAADVIVCPRQPGDTYTNKDLAGVGIAYKLAECFLSSYPLPGEEPDQWLDLVALGTVADLAPLSGENRSLVRRGIEMMRTHTRPGIQALANVSSIHVEELTSQHIGFMLGPRLNAAGRLSSAKKAYDLLMADTMAAAGQLALDLDEENQARRSITRDIQKGVEENYDFSEDQSLILFADKSFNEGVIGLAASRLVDSYYRPSVIGVEKDDVIRASCRSIPEVNITLALDECVDLLVQHGGHAMAAGLTVKKENVAALRDRLTDIIERELAEADLCPVLDAEMELALNDLHPSLFKYLDLLEPTGIKNRQPIFVTRGVEIRYMKTVGKNSDHLKLSLSDFRGFNNQLNRAPVIYDAIAFRFGYLADECSQGDVIDIAYAYEINTFRGRQTVQLNIRDIQKNNESHL